MLFACYPKIFDTHCLQFLLEVKMAPRETENDAYAQFWSDKQKALSFNANVSSFSLAKSPPRDLQITAYK